MRRKPFLLLLGFGLLLTGRLLLSAGETKQVASVTIVVTDPAGAAVPYAQIKLAPRQATTPKNPETNERGEISLNVLPGNYDLFVTAPDFAPWAKTIRVEANASQTVTVVLQVACTTQLVSTLAPSFPIVASATITIAVADATGAAVPYAQIDVCPKEITWKFHETDESGKFSLKLVPGSYELAVTSPGFRRWTKHVDIKEKENQTVNVILQVGGCPPGPCTAVDSTH